MLSNSSASSILGPNSLPLANFRLAFNPLYFFVGDATLYWIGIVVESKVKSPFMANLF
jgi:hypothetical protein